MALPNYYMKVLGTAMYPKVHAIYPDISVKLTNMLLQLSFVQVIQLINDEEILGATIEEAKRVYDANEQNRKQDPSIADTRGQVASEQEATPATATGPYDFNQAMQNLQKLNLTDPEAAGSRRQAIRIMISSLINECKSNIALSTSRYESSITTAQTNTRNHLLSLEQRRGRLQSRLRTLGDVVTMVQAAAPDIYDAMHGELWDDVAGIKRDVKKLKIEVLEVREMEKEVVREIQKKWIEERESWQKVGDGLMALGIGLGFQVEKKG
ncbi:Nn.00g090530.m01.CDS01 [Neocucurbitaria sp. VM-36]